MLTAACATITVPGADGQPQRWRREAFREYARNVFQRQNELVSEVIALAEGGGDAGSVDLEALYAAEARMNAACAALNSMASRVRSGERVRFDERLDVARSVPACDAAAQALQAALDGAGGD